MLDSGSAAVRDRNAAALDSRLCDRQEGMAERVGFEPTLPFRVNTLSKRAPSATRPSLRVLLKGRRAQEPGLTLFYRTACGAPAPRPRATLADARRTGCTHPDPSVRTLAAR